MGDNGIYRGPACQAVVAGARAAGGHRNAGRAGHNRHTGGVGRNEVCVRTRHRPGYALPYGRYAGFLPALYNTFAYGQESGHWTGSGIYTLDAEAPCFLSARETEKE